MADTKDVRYSDHEEHFRSHHRDTFGSEGGAYGDYEPAYRSGFRHGTASDYEGRSFGDLEPEMRQRHEKKHGKGTWQKVKDAARHAFQRGRSHRSSSHRTSGGTTSRTREKGSQEKAGTKGTSGSSQTASGDPGSAMRQDEEKRRSKKRNT